MLDFVVPVLLLVIGAALLTLGAEAFAEHVKDASSRLGVSVVALGVLLRRGGAGGGDDRGARLRAGTPGPRDG